MSAKLTAEETRGPGIVLQPEEGQSYWQPIWANGYSIVKLSPKHAGPDNLAMEIQIIAPGGYVREHSHTPNQEILFCFAGRGTIIVDECRTHSSRARPSTLRPASDARSSMTVRMTLR
jgi:quercetin dioxygenase-like cupin family protein